MSNDTFHITISGTCMSNDTFHNTICADHIISNPLILGTIKVGEFKVQLGWHLISHVNCVIKGSPILRNIYIVAGIVYIP